METAILELPEDFDDYAWEVESKGWFGDARVRLGSRSYQVTFYDPTRLAQELDDELKGAAVFIERNLLVVRRVDREHMLAAIGELAQAERYSELVEG